MASFLWDHSLIISNNRKVVLNKSEAFFEQIIITRFWNSEHGGIYVPIDNKTTPNPYLIDSLRDVVTTGGLRLTKINPAYMTRQISEIDNLKHDINFHITSLKPIRPANKADRWEEYALKQFEQDTMEKLQLIKTDSAMIYRYMAPLKTEKSCLRCHAVQGYKLGDIRGGISISFPAELYLKGIKKQTLSSVMIHFIVIFLGITGLLIYFRMSNKYFSIINAKNEELLQINATKDKFFSIVAHDLKSPFNNILGNIELLKTRFDEINEDQRRNFISEIDKSSQSTFHLLENLLLWARSQRELIIIKKEDLSLKKIVDEAVDPYLSLAVKKHISFSIEIPGNMNVWADRLTLKIIIANLFNNAVKFTHTNGFIKIEAATMDFQTVIIVADNGVGIPPKLLSNLFYLVESQSTSGTNNESGTGLGLILCKELVEKNGGKIWIESEVGIGTKIFFTLPDNAKT